MSWSALEIELREDGNKRLKARSWSRNERSEHEKKLRVHKKCEVKALGYWTRNSFPFWARTSLRNASRIKTPWIDGEQESVARTTAALTHRRARMTANVKHNHVGMTARSQQTLPILKANARYSQARMIAQLSQARMKATGPHRQARLKATALHSKSKLTPRSIFSGFFLIIRRFMMLVRSRWTEKSGVARVLQSITDFMSFCLSKMNLIWFFVFWSGLFHVHKCPYLF